MKVWINAIEMEWHRCPIRLELGRHVVPLAFAVLFLGVVLGYTWAYKALIH